jgi:hypothetical protein
MIAKGTFACLCALLLVGAGGGSAFGEDATPLEQAVRDGKVDAEVSGLGGSTGDAILIVVRRKMPEVLRLTLTPGTVFKSAAGAGQNMAGAYGYSLGGVGSGPTHGATHGVLLYRGTARDS